MLATKPFTIRAIKMRSTRAGCKGDPRMNRAVAARLRDPTLTLSEALFVGGFNYPSSDEASTLDNENVTLGQRKNQLLRRLRELSRKPKPAAKGSVQQPPSVPTNLANVSQQVHQDTLIALSQQHSIGDGWQRPSLAPPVGGNTTMEAAGFKVPAKPKSLLQSSPEVTSPLLRQQAFPQLEGMASVFAAPATMTSSSVMGGLSALGVPPQGAFSDTARNQGFQQQQVGPNLLSVAAAASLGASGLSSELEENRKVTAARGTSTSPNPETAREKEGLRHFQNGLMDLYRESMMKAGYTMEETQESSQSYRRFAFLAWQQECMRLQTMLGEEEVTTDSAASPDIPSSTI